MRYIVYEMLNELTGRPCYRLALRVSVLAPEHVLGNFTTLKEAQARITLLKSMRGEVYSEKA